MTDKPGQERIRNAALAAAVELGLPGTAGTTAELAARAGIDATVLARLFDVLACFGAATRDGDRLAIGVLEAPRTARGAQAIATVARRGSPITSRDPLSAQHDLRYLLVDPIVVEDGTTVREVAERIAPVVDTGSLLDAGGGLATYATAVLARAPRARALVVDLPPMIAQATPAPRLELRAGDLLDCDLGSGHRVALVSHVLHIVAPGDAQRILERVHAALAPGGLLVVKELRVASATGVLLALAMSLIEGERTLEDTDQLSQRIAQAGFADVAVEPLASTPDAVLLTARA